MEKYDYHEAIKNDIREWLDENQKGFISDERRDEIYEDLFINDSVTGNGSGSYTFNRWTAEENLCHNLDLLEEALDELGGEFKNDPEVNDVTIRCHLLGLCLNEVVDEWNSDHPETDAEPESEE